MRKPLFACLLLLASSVPVLAQATKEFKGHSGLIHCVAVSPDSNILATASFDNTVKLWDISTGKEKATLKGHTAAVNSVAFSPDGNLIATGGSDNFIRIWDKDGKLLKEMKGHGDLVLSVAFANDNQTLASGSKDKSVRLWNAKEGKEIKNLGSQQESVYTVAFSTDGNLLASGGYDTTIRIWDVKAQKEIKMLGELPKAPVKIDPKKKEKDKKEEKKEDKEKKEEKKEIKILEPPDLPAPVLSVIFAPGNETILAVGDKFLRFWSIKAGKETKKLGPTKDDLTGLALSKDGKQVATAGYGGSIRVYELESGKTIFETKLKKGFVTYSIAYAPDQKHLIIGSEMNQAAHLIPIGEGKVEDKSEDKKSEGKKK